MICPLSIRPEKSPFSVSLDLQQRPFPHRRSLFFSSDPASSGPSFHTPFAIQFDARVGFLTTYGSFADLPPVLWHSVIPGHFLPENSPYRPIHAPIRPFASQCNALLIHADISRRMTHKTDIPLHFYLDCLIIDITISLSEPECLRVTIYGIWPIGCSWKRLHLPLGKGMAAYENAAS